MWASILSLGLRLFVGLLIIGFASQQFVEAPSPQSSGPKFIKHGIEVQEDTSPQGVSDYLTLVVNTAKEMFAGPPVKEAPKSSLEQLRQRNSPLQTQRSPYY